MFCGRRFALIYLLLAASLAGAGVLGWSSATSATACNGPTGSEDPLYTAVVFIRSAVERDHVTLGYRLVTDSGRQGVSCRSWAAGKIPFAAYRHVDWGRSGYKVVAGGTGQIVMRVTLRSKVERPAQEAFLLELRQTGALWQVGSWLPVK